MRVLTLVGDTWHPPAVVSDGLKGLGDRGFRFDFCDTVGSETPGLLADYAAAILAKANHRSARDASPWLTAAGAEAVAAWVRDGGGLLVLHSGLVAYDDCPALTALVGGRFARHPEPCPVTVRPAAGRGLAADLAPFTTVDEHYFVALDDDYADVFLYSESRHGTQPAGWCGMRDAGRVCAVTPGHFAGVWRQRAYRAIVRQSLDWVAARAAAR
ncbi:MAG: ThuA domain-containing protein [Woeseiaceae bacterium]|nr:ThuA domain-containing protein [Woeseiaceae bacterium]